MLKQFSSFFPVIHILDFAFKNQLFNYITVSLTMAARLAIVLH